MKPPFFFLLVVALIAAGQTFDVATVKLSPPPVGNSIMINLGALRGDQLSFDNVTMNDLVKYAFELVSNAQLTGPAWINETRYNIIAKVAPATPPTAMHAMMRNLLSERFKLEVRREQKVLPHLALVLGKEGTKLHAVEVQSDPTVGPQVRGRINHPQMPMSGLVTLLSRFEGQTVVDETGLKDTYEIKLEWAPDTSVTQDARPGLLTAVQEQLGLKLESRRSPLEVLVIVGASRIPEDN